MGGRQNGWKIVKFASMVVPRSLSQNFHSIVCVKKPASCGGHEREGRGHADVTILKSKASDPSKKAKLQQPTLKAQYTLEVHARYTLSYCFPITTVVGVHSFKVFVIVS
jgi:hypothetical protein